MTITCWPWLNSAPERGLPDSRDRAKESITVANWLDDWAPLPPWS